MDLPVAVRSMEGLTRIREIIKANNCCFIKNRKSKSLCLPLDSLQAILKLKCVRVRQAALAIQAVRDGLMAKKVSLTLKLSKFGYKGLVVTQLLENFNKSFQRRVSIVLAAHLEGYLVTDALFGQLQSFSNVELQLLFNELTTCQGMTNIHKEVVFGESHVRTT